MFSDFSMYVRKILKGYLKAPPRILKRTHSLSCILSTVEIEQEKDYFMLSKHYYLTSTGGPSPLTSFSYVRF